MYTKIISTKRRRIPTVRSSTSSGLFFFFFLTRRYTKLLHIIYTLHSLKYTHVQHALPPTYGISISTQQRPCFARVRTGLSWRTLKGDLQTAQPHAESHKILHTQHAHIHTHTRGKWVAVFDSAVVLKYMYLSCQNRETFTGTVEMAETKLANVIYNDYKYKEIHI